jgi:hypothetical protein
VAREGFVLRRGKPDEEVWGPLEAKYIVDPEAAANAPESVKAHIAAAKTYIAGAKANVIKPFTPYQGEFLKQSKESIAKENSLWGMRFNSNTDFKPYHALDLIQAFIDGAVVGKKGHVYTKEIDFLIIFGDTGLKFNLSLAAVGDGKGGLQYDARQGMDPELVKWAMKRYPNAGGMLLALNNDAVIQGMRPENSHIGQIIPGHIGGISKEEIAALGWENVAPGAGGTAHEQPLVKSELAKGMEPGTGGVQRDVHKDDLETFLAEVDKRGLRPRYPQFIYALDKDNHIVRGVDGKPVRRWTGIQGLKNTSALMKRAGVKGWDNPKAVQAYGKQMEEGYMKMVRDFARVDTPFEAWKPKFNTKHLEKTFQDWLDEGVGAVAAPVDQAIVDEFLDLREKGELPKLDKPTEWKYRKPAARPARVDEAIKEETGDVVPPYDEERAKSAIKTGLKKYAINERLSPTGTVTVPMSNGVTFDLKTYDSGVPEFPITKTIDRTKTGDFKESDLLDLTDRISGFSFGFKLPNTDGSHFALKEFANYLRDLAGEEGMKDIVAFMKKNKTERKMVQARIKVIKDDLQAKTDLFGRPVPKRGPGYYDELARRSRAAKALEQPTGAELKALAKKDPIGYAMYSAVNYLLENMHRVVDKTEVGRLYGENAQLGEAYKGGLVLDRHDMYTHALAGRLPPWLGRDAQGRGGGLGEMYVYRAPSLYDTILRIVDNVASANGKTMADDERHGTARALISALANGDPLPPEAWVNVREMYKETIKLTLAHEALHGFPGTDDSFNSDPKVNEFMQERMNHSALQLLTTKTKEGTTLNEELDQYFEAITLQQYWVEDIAQAARDTIKIAKAGGAFKYVPSGFAKKPAYSIMSDFGKRWKFTEEEVAANAGRTAKTRSTTEGRSSHAASIVDLLKGKSVLDWGSGKGDDMKFYKDSGAAEVQGYDPNHNPTTPTGMVDIVTNTFVGNVLPPGLRRLMWVSAMARAKDKLFIGVRSDAPKKDSPVKREPIFDGMLMGNPPADGGLGTRTFQKYYTQEELIRELQSIFPSYTVEPGKLKNGSIVTAVVTRKKPSTPPREGVRSLEYGFKRGERRRNTTKYSIPKDGYVAAVKALPHGKQLPDAVYVHADGLTGPLEALVKDLREKHKLGDQYNIVKFRKGERKVSFLSYPDFTENPHPALAEAIMVDLDSEEVSRRDYTKNANPPILHHKEAFIPADHPDAKRFKALSDEEKAQGLLGGKAGFIGFRKQWEELLKARGLSIKDHRLVGDTLAQMKQAASKKLSPAPKFSAKLHPPDLPAYELDNPDYDPRDRNSYDLHRKAVGYVAKGRYLLGHDAKGNLVHGIKYTNVSIPKNVARRYNEILGRHQ